MDVQFLLMRLSGVMARYFGVIWLVSLVVLLAVGVGMARRNHGRSSLLLRTEGAIPVTRRDMPALLAFMAFVALYVYAMFWGEAFTYHDHALFTDYTVAGKPVPPPVWAGPGRFFPLAFQEFNLLARIDASPACYFTFAAVQLVIVLSLLFLLLRASKVWVRLLGLAVLMVSPGFASNFADLLYPERNVIFWVTVCLFCVDRFERRGRVGWLVGALVATHLALFYKEVTVLLFGTFAAARLCLSIKGKGWRASLERPLEVGMLLACAVFAVLLGVLLGAGGGSEYVRTFSSGVGTAISRYLTTHTVLTVFVGVFVFRAFRVVTQRRPIDPFWDALALAGAIHFVGVVGTGLVAAYYLGPTELVAAIILIRSLSGALDAKTKVRWVMSASAGIAALGALGFGSFLLLERKNVVRNKVLLADYLVSYLSSSEAQGARLYFPETDGGYLNDFISYLRVRGLPFERLGQKPPEHPIVVATPGKVTGGRCVSFGTNVCQHESHPAPGDVVVRLPDDVASAADATERVATVPLVEIDPIGFFRRLHPFYALAFRISPAFDGQPMPGDWLRASVERVSAVSTVHRESQLRTAAVAR